jgi:hypothetical protein
MMTVLKAVAACALLVSAVVTYTASLSSSSSSPEVVPSPHRRRLSMVGDGVPSHMDPLLQDLLERKKLFDETPPEEVKYWFEYTGALQV